MDVIIWIAAIPCSISSLYSFHHWKSNIRDDSRDFKYCMDDIRAMNKYNSYFLAGILIFFSISIEKGITFAPESSICLLALAFLSASLAIFFIPLKKPPKEKDNTQEESPSLNMPAKKLWLYTLIFTQFTVILTALGVLSAIVIRFELL